MKSSAMPTLASALLLSACGGDFAPYNLLEGLRVLAVRAEPPTLAAGQTATLDARVWTEANETVTYDWSWCPFTESRDTGFECAVTEQEVQAAVDEVLPPGTVTVDFDLGVGPTATLAYPGDASVVRALCEEVLARAAGAASDVISCDQELEVFVRLVASTASDSVTVVKRVPLRLDSTGPANTNPAFGPGVRVARKRGGVEAEASEIATDGSAVLAAPGNYRFWADVAANSFERFVPPADDLDPNPAERGESLFLTWFITAGETDAERTSFIEGESELDDLRENAWSVEELPPEPVELILVLRDERGGVTWTDRQIQMTEPQP